MIQTFDKPIKPTGGLVILKGNLAPEGCVMKIAAADRVEHRGPARVFDCEEDCFAAVQSGKIKPGDVLVIRYEGPKGGPGMREMLQVTAAVSGIPNSADTLRCSPTAASPARRADSPPATSRRKPLSADRLPRCAKATSFISTFRIAGSTLEDQR